MKIKSIFKALIFVYFELICCVKGLDLPADICEGKHNEFIPHPDLCTKFIFCYLATPFIVNCEYPTEVFHNGECVSGDPTTCEIFTPSSPFSTTTTWTISTTSSTTSFTTTSTTPQTTTTNYISTPPITLVTRTTTEIGVTTEDPTETTQSENSETTTQSGSTTIPHEISSGTSTTTRFATPPLTIVTRTTTTSAPEVTTSQRPTGPPELCDGYDFMFVIDPNYCFRFYFCMFGVASPYECAPHRIFDMQLQYCIDGYWDTCEPHTTTTNPITVTDEPTTKALSQNCDGIDFRFISNPNNCNKYYFCNLGTAIPYDCAKNQIFNEKFQACINGNWDTCE